MIKNYSKIIHLFLLFIVFSVPFLVRGLNLTGGFCNSSGGWGIVSDKKMLIFWSAVSLILLFCFLRNSQKKILKLGIWFVFLGGASNLFERIYWGCVFDYLKIFSWYPAFNLGDVLVVLGTILVLAVLLAPSF